MDRIFINAGGTSGFMAVGTSFRKITLATGASATLTEDVTYTALCYGGDTVLYGAYEGKIGSINQTTGAFTKIADWKDGKIDNIVYKDADELWFTCGGSLVLMDFTDGSYAYVVQDLQTP